jgi:hypothetical protein
VKETALNLDCAWWARVINLRQTFTTDGHPRAITRDGIRGPVGAFRTDVGMED